MIRIYQDIPPAGSSMSNRYSASIRIDGNHYYARGTTLEKAVSDLKKFVDNNQPRSISLYYSDLEDLDLFLSQHPEIQL